MEDEQQISLFSTKQRVAEEDETQFMSDEDERALFIA